MLLLIMSWSASIIDTTTSVLSLLFIVALLDALLCFLWVQRYNAEAGLAFFTLNRATLCDDRGNPVGR
jgi:hypothetical protein